MPNDNTTWQPKGQHQMTTPYDNTFLMTTPDDNPDGKTILQHLRTPDYYPDIQPDCNHDDN
jgi:hypothetical protein